MYLDGIPVTLLSDSVLLKEYNSIRERKWDEYYNDKGLYLFFRQRELMYELHSREIEVKPPYPFIGFDKDKFKHHTPPMGRRVKALSEAIESFQEGDMIAKTPTPRKRYINILAEDYAIRSIVQHGGETEHGRKIGSLFLETRTIGYMG